MSGRHFLSGRQFLSWICLALASTPLPAQQPAFKAAVELVTVPLTVTTRDRDRFITDALTPADFRVFEDGVPQTVTLLSQVRLPVSLCIVVDASGSMSAGLKHDVAVRALQATGGGLSPDDEIAIVKFAKTASVMLPWTPVPQARGLAWELQVEGETSLNDALRLALALTDEAKNPRRAILLITDGFENASRTLVSEVVTTRRQSETLVYAFGLVSLSEPRRAGPPTIFDRFDTSSMAQRPQGSIPNLDVLPSLVGDSGGALTRVHSDADAKAAAQRLISELRYQYTLGYVPTKSLDGKYRRIKVETTRRDLRVRHRGGYLALPSMAQ